MKKLMIILILCLSYLQAKTQAVDMWYVPLIADLIPVYWQVNNQTVYVGGGSTAGDGEEGFYVWDAASTATHDGFAVIQVTVDGNDQDPGRWIRRPFSGAYEITKLGTVTDGTWNAGTIETTYGGTGLGSFGTALQQIRVNSGATALEYFTPSGGSGDVLIGGNSPGSTMVIGTNDANSLSLETNNVVRATITGGASTGGAWTATDVTANTNTVEVAETRIANSTGAVSAGFGLRRLYQLETTTTEAQDAGAIDVFWITATHSSRTSAIRFAGVYNTGSIGEVARFQSATVPVFNIASAMGTAGTTNYLDAGITPGVAYNVGGAANQIVTLSSSSGNASGGIRITNSGTGSVGIGVSGAAQTSTTLARKHLSLSEGYAAASGSGTHNQLFVGGTFNMTSTSSGSNIGVDVNPTLTSLVAADQYIGLNMPYSNSNALGLNLTGSATTHKIVGKISFGSTVAPTALVTIAGGTTTVPAKRNTSGMLTTTALSGAEEYNNTHYLTKESGLRFGIGGTIADHYADVNNSGTSETDIYTYTTPASTLAADGEKLEFEYVVNLSDITSTATIKVYFGGTAIINAAGLAPSATGALIIRGMIIRTSSTTVRGYVDITSDKLVGITAANQADLTSLTLSGTNILKITGTAGGGTGGSNDITGKMGSVSWKPVAAN